MGKLKMKLSDCQCGCGRQVTKKKNKYINYHQSIGRKHSKETCIKMSEIKKGHKQSDEHRVKRSLSMMGKNKGRKLPPISEETRLKISEAGKGRILSEETKAKISKSHIGIRPSEETLLKLSIIRLKKEPREYCFAWYDEEYKDDCRKPACEMCNLTTEESIRKWSQRLCTHHLNGKKDCAPDDIQTLCRSCHAKVHYQEKEFNFGSGRFV
jgi:hypothetical protein